MPVFIRPARVEITEGSSPGAVVLVVLAVIAASAITSVLADIIVALAVAAGLAVAGSAAVLVYVLRRDRSIVTAPGRVLPGRPPAVITGPARPSIDQRRMLPGVVISDREAAPARSDRHR
jgi:hypothetical protein